MHHHCINPEMKKAFLAITLLSFMVLAGCRHGRLVTVWESIPPRNTAYSKIMVVSIPVNGRDSLRQSMEQMAVEKAMNRGYHVVAASGEFGVHGLADMGEEGTYLKLCEKGVDAVLTLALIDRSFPDFRENPDNKRYTSSFYYNRVWSYSRLVDSISPGDTEVGNHWALEAIFFDLNRLQPLYVVQAPLGKWPGTEEDWMNAADMIMEKLISAKVLGRKQAQQKKAF